MRFGTLCFVCDWADCSLLRGVMDAEQGKRYDAFYSVILPKQAVHRVS